MLWTESWKEAFQLCCAIGLSFAVEGNTKSGNGRNENSYLFRKKCVFSNTTENKYSNKLSKSDNRVVILRNVQRDQTGFYACEVSADAPLFHTDIKSALIIVVESPQEPPKIFTEKIKFSHNEIIKASCTSTKSYPATNLTWYINGYRAQSDTFKKITNSILPELGSLETSTSHLEIMSPSTSGVFIDGKLKLLCEATLFTIYKRTIQIEILDDTPQLAHVLSPTPSVANRHRTLSRTIVITWLILLLHNNR
ncbi:hypothetical protein PGB90_000511 [Kerria lacca]